MHHFCVNPSILFYPLGNSHCGIWSFFINNRNFLIGKTSWNSLRSTINLPYMNCPHQNTCPSCLAHSHTAWIQKLTSNTFLLSLVYKIIWNQPGTSSRFQYTESNYLVSLEISLTEWWNHERSSRSIWGHFQYYHLISIAIRIIMTRQFHDNLIIMMGILIYLKRWS